MTALVFPLETGHSIGDRSLIGHGGCSVRRRPSFRRGGGTAAAWCWPTFPPFSRPPSVAKTARVDENTAGSGTSRIVLSPSWAPHLLLDHVGAVREHLADDERRALQGFGVDVRICDDM